MGTYVEDLTKFTYDYARKCRKIDYKYVDKLADIVVNGEGLNDYVKNVTIKNRIDDSLSNYQPESGIIELNLMAVHKEFLKLCIHNYSISETEKEFAKCFLIEQSFLHECYHAKQLKMCYEKPNDLVSKIVLSAFAPFMQLREQINSQKSFLEGTALNLRIRKILSKSERYYTIDPSERLAEIESYKIILEMAKNLLLKKLYFYNEYELYDVYLEAYIEEVVPTLSYLQYMGYDELAQEIKNLTKDLKFNDRLLLGLDISEKEFNKLVRKQEDAWSCFVQS